MVSISTGFFHDKILKFELPFLGFFAVEKSVTLNLN